jgi:hypothetical protein
MAQLASPLARGTLLLANACAWVGCGWFMWMAWKAWTNSPPLHAPTQDHVWEIAGNCISFAFPYLTGWLYSLAAILTLSNFSRVLLTAPQRWVHGCIVLLCITSAVVVSWRLRGTAWACVPWFTVAVPAMLTLAVRSWRKNAYQIIGFMSGVDLLTIIPYSSWVAAGFAVVWICTALHFCRCDKSQNSP